MRSSAIVATLAALSVALVVAACRGPAPTTAPSAPPPTAPSDQPFASQPAENAGWSRIPIVADPALARAAFPLCVPVGGPKPGGGPLTLVVQDQRGPGAAFLVWANNDAIVSCLVMQQNGSLVVVAGFGSTGRGLSATLDVWGVNADAPHAIGGDTGSGKHVFILLADGATFEASRGGGRFGAWWPQPVRAVAVRSVDDLGALVETYAIGGP